MGGNLDKFLELDIPEELYLSRNIQRMVARASVAGAPPQEAAMAILAVTAMNVVELEERVLALEKHTGVEHKMPRNVL